MALKQEVSSQGEYVCFEDIRKMMYNYSKKQQRLFMKNPLLAFLMACFLTSEDALAYIQQNKMFSACPKNRSEFNKTKFKKIKEEITDLKLQAINAIQEHSNGIYSVFKQVFDDEFLTKINWESELENKDFFEVFNNHVHAIYTLNPAMYSNVWINNTALNPCFWFLLLNIK